MRHFMLAMAILLVCSMSGCGPINTPEQSTYALASFKPLALRKRISKTKYTLLVTTPVASPAFRSSKMLYEMIPYKLRAYSENRWAAPPAQMLLPLIATRLRSKAYFYAVVTPPFTGSANYRLDTHLLMLQQEFIQPTSLVRLALDASLVDSKTNKVIASREFMFTVPAPSNNPYGGVLAANKAAAQLTQRLARFVISSVG